MFPSSFYPPGYWPPNYFPKTGAEVRGGSSVAAGRMLQLVMGEEYRRQATRAVRMQAAREAAAQLSFELAMVRLRDLEDDLRRQFQLQFSVVATVLAEV